MKKNLLLTAAFCASLIANETSAQTRYLDEVFTSVTVSSNVVYGNNLEVLTGVPVAKDLIMDIYEPAGDSLTDRPLILYLHTGSFLPRYINQGLTGDKTDSATVEMCTRFAKQGYVVAAVSYRQGWNPAATTQEMRAQTIIQAVYRGLQDAKTCVRYFRKDVATNNNSYGIDDSRIAVGGQGSGGYISLAYATLNDVTEIQLPKFYNVTDGAFMVDPTIMGDFSGLGGNAALNNDNHNGYSDDILMTFNIGGALGDSTWLDAGEMPIVSMQGVADYFAPFTYGMVTVPGAGVNVVEVSGSSDVIRIANDFGNNDIFKTPAISDAFTTRADAFNTANDAAFGNDTNEGLFAFEGAANGNGPWEWLDTVAAVAEANAWGQNGPALLANFYATNPVFEGYYQAAGFGYARSRAIAYCDTIQGYLTPRLFRGLSLCDLTITVASTDALSSGAIDGSATVTVTSGSATEYAWSPTGGTGPIADPLAPGTYTVTVSDATGCSVSETVSVSDFGCNMTISTVVDNNETSVGADDGQATATAAGGDGTYTYTWSPSGGSSATASDLAPGTYWSSTQDASGCFATTTVTITAFVCDLAVTASATNDFGSLNNGTATAVATLGSTPYTYSWSPSGGSSVTASGLAADTYTVTVTDSSGCIMTADATVMSPQVGISENTVINLKVFPNPASDQISFISEDSNPISSIIFYSLEGKVVRTEANINATNVVVSNIDLPKGIYFATVRFKEGTAVKKIVIQ